MSDLDPYIFVLDLKSGKGGVLVLEVTGIFADLGAPKTRTLIYTDSFPTGVTVEGKSDRWVELWSEARIRLEEHEKALLSDFEEEDTQTWAEAANVEE